MTSLKARQTNTPVNKQHVSSDSISCVWSFFLHKNDNVTECGKKSNVAVVCVVTKLFSNGLFASDMEQSVLARVCVDNGQ